MKLKAREAVLKILDIFEDDQRNKHTSQGLKFKAENFLREIDPKDKPLFTMLYKGIFRWMGRIDSIIAEFSNYRLAHLHPTILNCLRIGLYEILFLSKIPNHASVNEAVNLVESKGVRSKALVNGILREVIRSKDRIDSIPKIKNTKERICHFQSYPYWLADIFLNQYGEEDALKIAESLNEEEPLTLRINQIKSDIEAVKKDLSKQTEDFSESKFCKNALVVDGRIKLPELESYQHGSFYIQNCSSQIASTILDPQCGETILDCCAGPGGKTTHILEMTKNRAALYSMDLSHGKLRVIADNAKILGVSNLKTILGDASKPLPKDLPDKFDRILVDPPCSALGTIRKNPEIKWLKTPSDPQRLAELQLAILKNVKDKLRKGGILLYSVCTFTKEETKQVAEKFLKACPDYKLDKITLKARSPFSKFITPEGYLSIPPLHRELEAFFIAKFKKA